MMIMYKPIYIVGLAHGGLTLLCNMLRQHPDLFTCSGKNIAFGGDEAHNDLYSVFPKSLRNPGGKGGSCWRYGLNIENHRRNEEHFNLPHQIQYTQIIDKICHDEGLRFLDKSKSYIIKMRYVQKLLDFTDTYFIHVIRSPYVMALKPLKFRHWYHDHKKLSDEQLMQRGSKIISENYRVFKEDAPFIKNLLQIRFEDLLLDTENVLRKISNFIEIDYIDEMMPREGDGKRDRKWYPIKKWMVNQYKNPDKKPYLHTPEREARIEAGECHKIIKDFNYPRLFDIDSLIY